MLKRISHTVALPTALAAALVLTACGTAGRGANDADVQFATMMIPHHAQAMAMADLALKQAVDPKVKALAPAIKRHHEGAVVMARTDLTKGKSPEARGLATAIIDGQSAEISEMDSILSTLPT